MLYMICGADVARPQGRIRSHIRTHGKVIRSLTPECTDLLEEMLQPDPVARASALQCYTHRWFTCDIPRSRRRGKLQTYRATSARESRGKRSHKNESKVRDGRSQSAPPCPTARL